MNKLPQELVDTIIDNLAEFDTPLEPEISRYSTVSRRWVRRTQKHHFKLVIFRKEASLKRWRKNINPDPSGVSRHVRQVRCFRIKRLTGFEEHLRAFTELKEAHFYRCDFRSMDRIRPLMPLASSLVQLEIHRTATTPLVVASLFAHFPLLHKFLLQDCRSKIKFS